MKFASVLIVDEKEDSVGLMINVGFVLGLTAGRQMPNETFGGEAIDGDGVPHLPLTCLAHFVRKAGQAKLRSLRSEFAKISEVQVTDYTRAALPSSYEAYVADLAAQSGEAIQYIGIHIFGPEEIIVPKTKNLSRR